MSNGHTDTGPSSSQGDLSHLGEPAESLRGVARARELHTRFRRHGHGRLWSLRLTVAALRHRTHLHGWPITKGSTHA